MIFTPNRENVIIIHMREVFVKSRFKNLRVILVEYMGEYRSIVLGVGANQLDLEDKGIAMSNGNKLTLIQINLKCQ